MSKSVLFQIIYLTISTLFSPILPIDRTLSNSTTRRQNGPESEGNKWVLHISQSSRITGASPSDCLVSYQGQSLGKVVPLCREAGGVFCNPSRMSQLLLCHSQIGSGCRIHQLHLCWRVKPRATSVPHRTQNHLMVKHLELWECGIPLHCD